MAAKSKLSNVQVSSELEAMRTRINKERGDGIMLSARNIPIANHIPTGNFLLDYATLGGIPEGYATMIYGYESGGKTFLAKKAVAGFQRKHKKKVAVWVDTETLFDSDWAEKLGCDLDRLEVSRPTTGNEAVDIIEALMSPREVGLIVLDSIPGCVPQRVQDKSAEDSTVGELARLMGIMCSKILCSWAKERRRNHYVTVILINQFRAKIGVMFGDPRTLPGGRQINHLPTTKIEVKNNEIAGKDSFDTQSMIRNEHSFRIIKAKHGRSLREGEFHVSLSAKDNDDVQPFDFINHKTVVAQAKKMGVFVGGGGKYRFDVGFDLKNHTFRTMDDSGAYLREHPKTMLEIQRHLIMLQRADKGLPPLPPDDYLLREINLTNRVSRRTIKRR